MKRFMKLMSVVLVLGAVATAEGLGGNPEILVQKNGSETIFTNCDPLERFLGLCRSSNNILGNN
jgi:hypothetical protein